MWHLPCVASHSFGSMPAGGVLSRRSSSSSIDSQTLKSDEGDLAARVAACDKLPVLPDVLLRAFSFPSAAAFRRDRLKRKNNRINR